MSTKIKLFQLNLGRESVIPAFTGPGVGTVSYGICKV